MNIGFTGTRKGMTPEQQAMLRCIFGEVYSACNQVGIKLNFDHGGAEGADYEAHCIAKVRYFETINIYPCRELRNFNSVWNNPLEDFMAKIVLHRPAPPLDRNRVIVAKANGMIATPAGFEEELKSGTWATIRYTRAAKVPLKIIWPNGSVTVENSSIKEVKAADVVQESNLAGKVAKV